MDGGNIALRRMSAADFERFRRYSVGHHAKDLERFYPPEVARPRAEEEFFDMLPEGPDTPENHLMTVVDRDDGRAVGMISEGDQSPSEAPPALRGGI